jgi:hypothetical protein
MCLKWMLQAYVSSVSDVSEVCCKCFIRIFPMFHLFFRRMLQVCLCEYCICFTHMLQVFYLDVAYVYNGFKMFSDVFASVSNACFKCFIGLLLHFFASVASGYFKSKPDVAHRICVRSGRGRERYPCGRRPGQQQLPIQSSHIKVH